MNRNLALLLLLAVLALVSVAATRAPQQAPVWEHTYTEALQYMPDKANWPGWREGSARLADVMSAQGWQLVQVVPLPREDNSLLGVGMYFRRPRQ
jgi:hypothetical protein